MKRHLENDSQFPVLKVKFYKVLFVPWAYISFYTFFIKVGKKLLFLCHLKCATLIGYWDSMFWANTSSKSWFLKNTPKNEYSFKKTAKLWLKGVFSLHWCTKEENSHGSSIFCFNIFYHKGLTLGN